MGLNSLCDAHVAEHGSAPSGGPLNTIPVRGIGGARYPVFSRVEPPALSWAIRRECMDWGQLATRVATGVVIVVLFTLYKRRQRRRRAIRLEQDYQPGERW